MTQNSNKTLAYAKGILTGLGLRPIGETANSAAMAIPSARGDLYASLIGGKDGKETYMTVWEGIGDGWGKLTRTMRIHDGQSQEEMDRGIGCIALAYLTAKEGKK